MKAYIGTKIVNAEPMDEFTFQTSVKHQDVNIAFDYGARSRPGYLVIYEDGYQSWSPKETFERAYREVTDSEKKLVENLE